MQASSAIVAGLGLALVGYGGRALLKVAPTMATKVNEVSKMMPKIDTEVGLRFVPVL